MSIDVNVQNDLVIVTESSEDITVNVSNAAGPAGVGVPVGGTTGQVLKKFTNTNYDTYWAADASGLTSVGLSMPSAFAVSNSPLTSNGTIAVTGAGTASQYVRGDGSLATLPSNSSGGSSVAYYLNGSVAASVGTYYQMSKTAVIGTGTDFSKAGNGLISQFLTDVADPNRLEIPAGAWNFEMYFSASSSGGTPAFYVELLKYNGTTFTSIASSSAVPEAITSGTIIDLYLTSLAIPQTTLLSTDRLAIRVYIVNSTGGRTITMHTENSHLCEIITNFAGGVSALNGLTANTQYFATGTSGTDFAISSATDTHTFNLPTASATNRGALSSADWSTFSGKVGGSGTTNYLSKWTSGSALGNSNLINDASGNLGLGVTPSAWTNCKAIDISTIGSVFADGFSQNNQAGFATNAYRAGAAVWYYKGTAAATYYAQDLGTHKWFNAPSGTAGNSISFTQAMTLTANGRLLLGTATESTFLLDVNGTARVSGVLSGTSATFSTGINITGNGGAVNAANKLGIDQNLGAARFYSNGGDASTKGSFEFHTNSSNGSLDVIALGISSTGAATFSSSVTAIKSLIGDNGFGSQWATFAHADATGASNAFVGIDNSNGSQISNIKTNGSFEWRVSNSNVMSLKTNGNLLVGTTVDSGFKLDVNGTARVSGAATFSSSVTASSFSIPSLSSGNGAYNFVYSGNTSSRSWRIVNDVVSFGDFAIQQSTTHTGSTYASLVYVSAGGNLLVGTTTDSGQRLQVQGNAIISTTSQLTAISSTGGLFISNSTTSANGVIGLTGAGFILQGKDGASTAYPLLLQPYGSNVGIGTSSPSASAILQADSTTRGFLPPRMTNAQRTAISSPAVGLIVYCTDMVEGLYVYKSTGWTFVI